MKSKAFSYYSGKVSREFRITTLLIRIVIVCIGLIVLAISRYAFVLFAAAMLPSIVAIFIDRTNHKCGSATVCSFNLIGTLPYLIRLWDSNMLTSTIRLTISDIRTWLVIYGVTLVGQFLYWGLPLIFSKLYVVKSKVQTAILSSERDRICADWGIKSDDPYGDLTIEHLSKEKA
jgi:hypothetical protein